MNKDSLLSASAIKVLPCENSNSESAIFGSGTPTDFSPNFLFKDASIQSSSLLQLGRHYYS